MANIESIKDALCDVRKAHRIIYAYQKRMMGIVRFIGKNWISQYVKGINGSLMEHQREYPVVHGHGIIYIVISLNTI